MRRIAVSVIFINICYCMLWKNGIVYYTINKLDYDVHSQDEISSALGKLQEEICIKFFQQPPGANHTVLDNKLLFITNPDKVKNSHPRNYDFERNVILMPIGYKCLNDKAIARLVADMLRASIEHTVSTINSYDLVKKFQEKDIEPSRQTLLSAVDRNFINAHYHSECGTLFQRVVQAGHRRQDDSEPRGLLTDANVKYYEDKLWPLGIVIYGVEEKSVNTKDYQLLRHAMTSIELLTCIVFEEHNDQVLTPRNMLWFGSDGEEVPHYGFQSGNQSIKLESMVHGAPGHVAHALNNLMRVLGVHMMSNRFDRDNYVTIKWKNVVRGKERLLDKAPRSAWLEHMAYDFNSVTHAPANYACQACELGGTTIQPNQDHLWQKTMSMGHTLELSESDIQLLKIIYDKQCQKRLVSLDNTQ